MIPAGDLALMSISLNLTMFILQLFEFTFTLFEASVKSARSTRCQMTSSHKIGSVSKDKSMNVGGTRQAATVQRRLSFETGFNSKIYVMD